jgi:hypothetical protein
MAGPNPAFESLSGADLLAATRGLVRQSQGVEAERHGTGPRTPD